MNESYKFSLIFTKFRNNMKDLFFSCMQKSIFHNIFVILRVREQFNEETLYTR